MSCHVKAALVGALCAALLLWASLPTARAEALRVLHAEPLQLSSGSAAAAQKPGRNTLGIKAFGRSFTLELDDNSRLLRSATPATKQQLGEIQLYRGSLTGVPGSWVRLIRIGDGYSGAFWDGTELYAIEPSEAVEPLLTAPLPLASRGSAIYRLSDTEGGAIREACAVDAAHTPASTPLDQYRALIRDLKAAAATAFAGAAREIEVSVIGDYEFTQQHGAAAVRTMLNRMNIVDGIFSSQVGVTIVPTDFITFASDSDPFTSSDAGTLLNQLAGYRNTTPLVRSRGLAHLLTGRPLNGNTAGIAYVGSLCVAYQGVGLSESPVSIDSALVIAHEIGHNFGARHDGESGSPCASTPQSYLMSPYVNGSNTFSQCSLQSMQPYIAGASCIVAARNRDVGIAFPAATIQTGVGLEVEYLVDITSLGGSSAVNVITSLTAPYASQVLSASMPDANCSVAGNNVNCTLPELAAGTSRRLSVRANALYMGDYEVTASVSATGDTNAANNAASARVHIAAAHDASVTVSPQPLTVTRGTPFEVTLDIIGTGVQRLTDLTAEITAYYNVIATAAVVEGGGTCTTGAAPRIVVCSLGSLDRGASRRLRLTMVSTSPGEAMATLALSAAGAPGWQRHMPIKIDSIAVRDVSITPNPGSQIVAVGEDGTWDFEIVSRGISEVQDISVDVSTDPLVTLSFDEPAGVCVPAGQVIRCTIGSLAAGARRMLRVRARSDTERNATVLGRLSLAEPDEVLGNDLAAPSLQFLLAEDAQVSGSTTYYAYDERPARFTSHIRSRGAYETRNLRATATLPPGFVIESATLQGGECTIAGDATSSAVCSIATVSKNFVLMAVDYRAPQPGTYTGTLELSAPGDLNPDNDVQSLRFEIAPNIDARLSVPQIKRAAVDTLIALPFTVHTNRYALTDARIEFSTYDPATYSFLTEPGVTCTPSPHSRYICSLGTVPANSTATVTLQVQASRPVHASVSAWIYGAGEANNTNNHATVHFHIVRPADVVLDVASPPGEPIEGQAFALSSIDLSTSGEADFVKLEIDVDLERVIEPTLEYTTCTSGTRPLTCNLGTVSGGRSLTLRFTPRGTGELPIKLRVTALNDFNAENDEKTVTLNVVAAPAPTPPPPAPPPTPPATSGGGGGGGTTSLPLVILGLLWLRLRSRPPRLRIMRLPFAKTLP